MTLALRYAVRSDVGLLREGNEDSAYAGPHLLAVADGMGGYEAGEVASAAVISTVAPLDGRSMKESELMDALASAVTTAKQALRKIVDSDPTVGSMGTTLTAMLWSGGSAAICHIGDSRAYLVREGDLYQITHDHTFVQALIDQGRIRPEEASSHPQRSLLLRALDGRTDADPDLAMLTAELGDRYLICSDGLSVAVSDDAILQSLMSVDDPSDAVVALIDLAIKGGAPDNVTCIVADVIDPSGGLKPTKAPVLVGAAAMSADHDTKPFTRPATSGGMTGTTLLGTAPATAARPGTTIPGRARPQPAGVATATAGRQGSPPEVATREDEDLGSTYRRRKRRWPVMTSILALFVLLVGAGLVVGYQYVHSQYYVGTAKGKVVIYRGLNQSLLGISLRSVYRQTGIPVSGITSTDATAIKQTSGGSLSAATRFANNIRSHYRACLAARAAVRSWEQHKPKPVPVRSKKTGKIIRYIHPTYRPKPTVPAACPPAPGGGA